MTEIVTLRQEHQTATSLYGQTGHLMELFEAVRKVAPWANARDGKMSDMEIALVVRKAVAMGLDPLNPHEVQIWKDGRGSVNFQVAYPLMIEWVRHFFGAHTEPQKHRLTADELKEEGAQPQDVGYRVTFLMENDLPKLAMLIAAGYTPEEARKMLEVTGVGIATAQEYNGSYFAPNGRSKAWKVQKRAITDAYRRKFGMPNRAQIEELRRAGGFENLRPEDWEDGSGLAPDDAAALAQSNAHWREHNEALKNDPEYRAAHEAQSAAAADSLWGSAVEGELVTTPDPTPDLDYDGNLLDNNQLEADIAHAVEVAAESAAAPDLSAFDATPFASPTAATAWAVSLGAFGKPDGGTGKHARAAWNEATEHAQNDSERAQMWRADVARRLAESQA